MTKISFFLFVALLASNAYAEECTLDQAAVFKPGISTRSPSVQTHKEYITQDENRFDQIVTYKDGSQVQYTTGGCYDGFGIKATWSMNKQSASEDTYSQLLLTKKLLATTAFTREAKKHFRFALKALEKITAENVKPLNSEGAYELIRDKTDSGQTIYECDVDWQKKGKLQISCLQTL